jgi:hypothetical protein
VSASSCANAYCHNNIKSSSQHQIENGKEMNPKMPIASTLPQIHFIFFWGGGGGGSSVNGKKKQERDANVPIFHLSSRQLSLEVTFENIKHLLIC